VGSPPPSPHLKKPLVNRQIRAEEIRVIDETGKQLGVMGLEKALQEAEGRHLDLIQVTEKVTPAVCKIMDYGQFKYERDKKLQKQKVKSKKTDTKGIRLSVRIGEHDLQVRYNKAKNFLLKGDKVKIEIRLRGRERQHPEVAAANINKFVKQLQADSELSVIVEEGLTKQETSFNMLLVNKKS